VALRYPGSNNNLFNLAAFLHCFLIELLLCIVAPPAIPVLLLCIVAPPAIPVSRQSRSVLVGSRVTLTCQTRGNPPPYVVWSKRGGELPRSELDYIYKFLLVLVRVVKASSFLIGLEGATDACSLRTT